MDQTSTYCGNTFRQTNITTDNGRGGVGYLYEITGPQGKSASRRPFLTSVAACREYVRGLRNQPQRPADSWYPQGDPMSDKFDFASAQREQEIEDERIERGE